MPKYRVQTSNIGFVDIEADYFNVTPSQLGESDVYFYIQKPRKEDRLPLSTFKEVTVAYVRHPLVIETLDDEPEDD